MELLKLADRFGEYGILGIIVLVLLAIIVWLIKGFREDINKMTERQIDIQKAANDSTNRLSDVLHEIKGHLN